ncbi:hemin uptake protein HemP [Fulvimarina sp. MAC8]
MARDKTVLSTEDLFVTGREVEIHHQNFVYRLRLTRTGKLILTK